MCCGRGVCLANLGRQIYGITLSNLRGIVQRRALVAATALCVALVVATLLGLGALSQGLQTAIEQSGARDVALIMRGGTQSEINSAVNREQLDLLRQAPGVRVLSPELNLIVDGHTLAEGTRTNISLRGLTQDGIALRRGVRLIEGRWPSAGVSELAVGQAVARTYRNMELGAEVRLGASAWKVVGVFRTGGTVAESEIWADLAAAQSLFQRPNVVQSVRVGVDGGAAIEALANFSQAEPRLQLAVQSEAQYYGAQASRTSELAEQLAWPLALLMAIGAVVGALNTMQAAVAERAAEIAVYRAIGFARTAIATALVIECVAVCTIAGVLGAALAYVALDGLTTTTLGGGITRIGYALKFTASGFWQGIGLAATIGVLGAALPAVLACTGPVNSKLVR